MDEQAQVVELRRRLSRAETEQLVTEYEASGLSQVEFCRRHGLSLATLGRYRKRRRPQAEATGSDRWVAVELHSARPALESPAGSGLAVALPGGRRIEVGRGFDAHTLVELLGLLERR
jgi:transposase-like protein